MSFLLNNPAWNSTSPAFLQTHLFSIREHFLYYLFIILTSRPSSPSGTHDTQVDKTHLSFPRDVRVSVSGPETVSIL